MNYFKEFDMISDYQVSKRTFIDGVKLNLGSKSKILVRPSGTEPLLRIYFESDSLESLEKLDAAIRKLIKEI